MGAHMKKRILPVIIAILLILVIAGGALGKVLLDKYSYSKEEADWNEFYQVSESDRSAIILQDEMVEEQALIRDDVCYFDLATVHKYMNEVFYADMTEKLLLYANPTEVIRTTFGETSYTTTEGTQDAGYVISFVEGDTVYVAADYVKLFTNYSYDCYDRHVQVYTEWGTRQVAQLKKDTAVRLRGGVKSPILTQAAKGDTLEILEQMETWSKVKTADSVIGDVEWDIKESNTVYTSILAKYKVSCTDEEGAESIYNVKEFFRVRFLVDTIYLLDYNRNMEQVFDGRESDFDENGIILGIIPKDISYEINKDQTSAAFVQAGELWLYESKKGNLTKVFSMPDQEGRDTRGENDQHAVRVIGIDNKNNITFAVYGYMARGSHEGEVGVGIYYYDAAENKIEEKAFITSTKSFAIAEDELGKMVYYNQSTSLLHVLADGTLYRIDLKKDEKKVLAENLTDERYAVSDDGHLMVYQTGGKTDKSATLHIMNLKSGEDYTIKAEDGENLRPLGFINGDFIYGKVNLADTGITVSGEEITPMYEVQIRNSKNKEAAQYNFTEQSIYTTDVLIDGNLLTFNRVIKDGETYNSTKQEYVTNNEERKESKIVFETYVSENTGKQMRFTFADGVKKKQKQNEKPIYQPGKKTLTIELKGKEKEEKYYVYGMGELAAVYNKAGYAVQKAEQVSGVVISSEQKYVWEKGNRDLVYSTEAGKFQCEEGESSLDACERYMEQYHAQRLDLTGCSLDQMLYVINRGCPMIAILESAHAVLLTGYTMTDITYVDPSTGESYTVGMSEMENMTEAGGNTFIGYIR